MHAQGNAIMGPRDLERYKRLLLAKLYELSATRTETESPVFAAGAHEGDQSCLCREQIQPLPRTGTGGDGLTKMAICTLTVPTMRNILHTGLRNLQASISLVNSLFRAQPRHAQFCP